MGIGAAVATFVGSTGWIAGAIAGAIDFAVVGAVVGGLTSAVMGGDILSGVLMGAVGGAVTGGVLGAFSPGMFGVGVSAAAETTAVTSSMGWESVVAAGGDVVGSTGATTVGAIGSGITPASTTGILGGVSTEGLLGKGAGELLAAGVGEGVKGMLAGKSTERAAEIAAEAQKAQNEANKEQLQMKLDSDERIAASSSSGVSSAEKSQQLASTIANLTGERNLQKEAWQKEDTAKAKMAAAAKSLFRADDVKSPNLTAEEVAALQGTTPAAEYVDPTEAAIAAHNKI